MAVGDHSVVNANSDSVSTEAAELVLKAAFCFEFYRVVEFFDLIESIGFFHLAQFHSCSISFFQV